MNSGSMAESTLPADNPGASKTGKPFFTVVCACCDVQDYVAEMVDSLKRQSFGDFECILVVESSRDKTLEVSLRCIEGDERFYIVEQPRSGSPAAPRNTGIMLAKGKYIAYLDGDDFLAEDSLAATAKALKEHDFPELVQMATEEWLEEKPGAERTLYARHYNYGKEDDGRVMSGAEAILRQAQRSKFPSPMASLTVCRVDYIRDNDLYFYHGLKHEDEEWTPRALFLASRVLVLDLNFYVYRRRGGSITMQSSMMDMRSVVRFTVSRIHFYCGHQVPAAVGCVWERSWLSSLFQPLFYPVAKERRHSNLKRLAVLRHYLRDEVTRQEWRKFAGMTRVLNRMGIKMILWCTRRRGFRSILPCDLYFRLIYYPVNAFGAAVRDFLKKR